MGNVKINTEIDEMVIENILKDISDIVEVIILETSGEITKMLKNKFVRHFTAKLIKQWKFGEKLTNPLVTFTKELKAGHYDELYEKDIDLIHQAALNLSGLWRSDAEISADTFKSNLGYLLVQETIIRMIGNLKADDYAIKAVLSALSCDEKCR